MAVTNVRSASGLKINRFENLPLVTAACCALWVAHASAAPAGNAVPATESSAQVERLLADAASAEKTGNLNLAIIQLKNAVQLQPANGTARARLGIDLLRTGQAAAAERELRQAQRDHGASELVLPALLQVMVQRRETRELLAEFPDPAKGTEDKTAPDVLMARAMALESLGQAKDARVAMDRSLALRRDAAGLINSARLAQTQRDPALARRQVDEALQLSPTNEAAMTISIALSRVSDGPQKALVLADEYVKRAPGSIAAKVSRMELLLELKQDARAKDDVEAIAKQAPKSAYVHYYRGVLLARAGDNKGAWEEMRNLPPAFVEFEPSIANMVARVAIANDSARLADGILTALLARHPDDHVGRLQLAALRLGQNSPQSALEVLAPLKSSGDPAAHALLAQAYLALGRFDEATPSLKIANSLPDANALLQRDEGLWQLEAGENDKAIQTFRDLWQRDTGNPQAAAPLIAALTKAARWDEAMAVADQVAKKKPDSPLGPLYRGQILMAHGKLDDALPQFNQALAIDPKFALALYGRTSLWLARDNFRNAKDDLERIIAQNPQDSLAYIRLAGIAAQNGDDQDARSALDRAIKAAPRDPGPRLALAGYQVQQRQYQDALRIVTELLASNPDNPEALALRGRIELSLGQTAGAIRSFQTLASGPGSSPAAFIMLSRALVQSKNYPGAEEAATKGVALAPSSAQLRLNLIDVQIASGKGQDALTTAQTYSRTHPGPDADLLLADTLLRQKRASEAEALLDKSLAATPDPRIAIRLSQVAMGGNNFKKASSVLSAWIMKNPGDYEVRRQYADLLLQSADLRGARTIYEALLKEHQRDASVLNNLGWLLQKDDPDRAVSLVTLATKIAPQSAEIADTLGWIKYRRADRAAALPILTRAHDLNPGNGTISYHLAVVMDANGDRAKALSLLQTALAKNPKFDGASDAATLVARWKQL